MNVELTAGVVKDQHQSLEVLGREVSSLRDSVSMLASMTDKILGR